MTNSGAMNVEPLRFGPRHSQSAGALYGTVSSGLDDSFGSQVSASQGSDGAESRKEHHRDSSSGRRSHSRSRSSPKEKGKKRRSSSKRRQSLGRSGSHPEQRGEEDDREREERLKRRQERADRLESERRFEEERMEQERLIQERERQIRYQQELQELHHSMQPPQQDDVNMMQGPKRVTFALGPDGAVGRSVHFFINENYAELWWDEDELVHTLRQCMRAVASMRASAKDYVRSLTRLYQSYKKSVTEAQTSKSLQVVANAPQARGLELHVAQKLRALTHKQRRQVLEVQERLRNPHLGGSSAFDDQVCQVLRKEAMKHSRPCRQFAFMIAQYDTHEALKASLSSWSDDEED